MKFYPNQAKVTKTQKSLLLEVDEQKEHRMNPSANESSHPEQPEGEDVDHTGSQKRKEAVPIDTGCLKHRDIRPKDPISAHKGNREQNQGSIDQREGCPNFVEVELGVLSSAHHRAEELKESARDRQKHDQTVADPDGGEEIGLVPDRLQELWFGWVGAGDDSLLDVVLGDLEVLRPELVAEAPAGRLSLQAEWVERAPAALFGGALRSDCGAPSQVFLRGAALIVDLLVMISLFVSVLEVGLLLVRIDWRRCSNRSFWL